MKYCIKYYVYLHGGKQLLTDDADYRAACRHARSGKVVIAKKKLQPRNN